MLAFVETQLKMKIFVYCKNVQNRVIFSAGAVDAVQVLLQNSAKIDELDVKAQTPLFVAMVNQHWECARYLFERNYFIIPLIKQFYLQPFNYEIPNKPCSISSQ